jgi:hypothetical protein
MNLTRSRRGNECLSDLRMDAILAADDAATLGEVQPHLEACDRCRDRLAVLRADRDCFLASHPAHQPKRTGQVGPGRWWPRVVPGVAALAAAAALLLWLRRPTDTVSGDRAKGGSTFGFYVKHGESVVRGGDDQRVQPGDQLRFVVRSTRRNIGVLSVDGQRRASIYFPAEPRTAEVDAVQELSLPQSTRLDDALGRETLYGLFCDAPTDLAPVRDRLEAEPSLVPTVAGCEVLTMTIKKDR